VRSSARVSLCGAACPDIVTVSGAEATRQGPHMGTYMKVPGVVQESRPVYRMGSTGHYLFYFTTNSWNIGADYKVNFVGLQSFTAAACPDQATGWTVYTGTAWVNTYPVKVKGARIVVAIVVAAAAAALIVILTFHHNERHHYSYSCSCIRTLALLCLQTHFGTRRAMRVVCLHANQS
jgi:hypothetical protein